MSLLSRARAAYSAFTESRTIEDPRTSLSNPANWLTEWVTGAPSSSGVAVNERSALGYSATFACINVLSKDVGQLPAQVFKRNGEDRELARDHRVYKLLHDRPNPYMTPFTMKQTITAHMVGWGNGFLEIESNGAGEPVNLWPLPPSCTKAVVRPDGTKVIVTTRSNGQEIGLPAERVLHLPGLGFDGISGYSVISLARESIGTGMAAEKFSAGFFKRGAIPGLVLQTPNKLSPEARKNIKESWKMQHEGLDKSHRTALLEEGVTINTLGISQKDSEFLETSKFSIEQVARFFDVPLMRLHSTTAITSWGTGLEQWNRGYLVHTLGPWLTLWEESCNWALLRENERKKYYVEFLRESLLQGDMAAKVAYYQGLFGMGAISPNGIARKENLPAAETGGDARFVPLNYVPLDLAINPPEPSPSPFGGPTGEPSDPPPDPPARARHTALMRQRIERAQLHSLKRAVERYVRQEAQAARAALKRGTPAGFQAAMDTFWVSFPESMTRDLSPVLRSYFDLLVGAIEDEGRTFTLAERELLEHEIAQFERRIGTGHIRASQDGFRDAIIGADEPMGAVESLVTVWETSRAENVSRSIAAAFADHITTTANHLFGFKAAA